jgi:hypothetical protein
MERIANTKYFITKNGVIINSKTKRKLKPQNNGNGYLKITLTIEGLQIQRYVHRLVGLAFIPNPLNRKQINHKNGIKIDNRIDNLEWVTCSENAIHAHKMGLKANGDKLWNGKFNKEDINKINKMDMDHIKRYKIAEIMGCAKSTISDILNGKRYLYYQQERN